jgi:hypothetical protein
MNKMKKILKVLCITVLLQPFAGCEKYMEGRKMGMPQWSYARQYLPLLRNLSCQRASIVVDDDSEWTLDKLRLKGIITGRWKLLLDFSAGNTIDYSCKSVIYTFDADSTVMIESNVKEIPGGQFEYDYRSDPFCHVCLPGPDGVRPNLIIGENKSFCQVAEPWLIVFAVDYVGSDRGYRGKTERIFCKID